MTTKFLAPVLDPASVDGSLVYYDHATGALKDGSALAGGTFIADSLASDATATSTTALADSGLEFAVGAGEKWKVQAVLVYDGATTGDLKVGFSMPASTSWVGHVLAAATGVSAASTATSAVFIPIGSGTLPTSASVGAAGTGTKLAAIVTVHITALTNAGTVKLQFAQGTSDATATTLYTGSSLIAERVA